MSNRIKNNLKNLVGQTLNQYYSKVKPTISDLRYKQEYQNRIIECMVGEVDDNYVTTPETDNPIVKLEHSKEGVIKIPQIKGKTILIDEDGNKTDTLGEGCRLVSVGEEEDNKLIILSKNKNLFDENELKQEPISTDFSYVNQDNKRCIKNNVKGWRYLKILNNKFKENTIYRITYCAKNTDVTSNGTGAYFILEYTDGTISPLYTNNLNGQWFEVSGYSVQGKTIKCVNFSNAGNCITYIDLDSIIITEGTEKVEYIPSKQHKTEILLDEPLRKLPNGVCDKIINNQLIRRVGKMVLNGNENWERMYYPPSENGTHIQFSVQNYFENKNVKRGFWLDKNLFICDIFPRADESLHWSGMSSIGVGGDDTTFMFTLSKNHELYTIIKDVSELKEWLSDNPITVLYELEEPIIEELPNSITLQGFDNTTMYIENSITPIVSYGYNALIPYKEELRIQKEEVEINTLDIENNIIPYLMDMEYNLMLMEDN